MKKILIFLLLVAQIQTFGQLIQNKPETTRANVQATNTSGQSVPASSTTTITNWTEQVDANGDFNASTGVFTAPRTADYHVVFAINYSGTATLTGAVSAESSSLSRGVYLPVALSSDISNSTPVLSTTVRLTVGATFTPQSFQSTGTSRTLNTGANRNYISIQELPPTF